MVRSGKSWDGQQGKGNERKKQIFHSDSPLANLECSESGFCDSGCPFADNGHESPMFIAVFARPRVLLLCGLDAGVCESSLARGGFFRGAGVVGAAYIEERSFLPTSGQVVAAHLWMTANGGLMEWLACSSSFRTGRGGVDEILRCAQDDAATRVHYSSRGSAWSVSGSSISAESAGSEDV